MIECTASKMLAGDYAIGRCGKIYCFVLFQNIYFVMMHALYSVCVRVKEYQDSNFAI